jgi:endonuclease/exonuclease/phosphatase family metal-dependent hydrolase
MRFLLYNIRYGAGIGAHFHLPVPYAGYLKHSSGNLEQIISFIETIKPDIIGLIEVDSGSYRSDRMCQAEIIARQLGHFCVVESKYGQGSLANRVPVLNKQSNGILTNLEILSHRFHYFEEGVKRLVIEVQLEKVTVFLIHLSLTFRKRQYQLERLYRIVSDVPAGPIVVAGDFNVLWGNRELDLFLAATGLVSANCTGLPSHPSRSPRRQLDFILHSKDLKSSNFSIPPVTFSDHAPLVCDLSFC